MAPVAPVASAQLHTLLAAIVWLQQRAEDGVRPNVQAPGANGNVDGGGAGGGRVQHLTSGLSVLLLQLQLVLEARHLLLPFMQGGDQACDGRWDVACEG